MMSENEKLSRLFRTAVILTAAMLAVAVVSVVTTELMVRLVARNPEMYMLTVVKVHNIVQLVLDYGLSMAVFAVMIATAKHLPSHTRANLLRIGGVLGVVINALMLAVMLTGYVRNPPPALESWFSMFHMFSTHPIKVMLPYAVRIPTLLCAACFVFHVSPTVNLTAILKIACVGLLLLLGLLGLSTGIWALLCYVIGLVSDGLSIVMYVALSKYYKQDNLTDTP